mgnify:CR=1 FL=1
MDEWKEETLKMITVLMASYNGSRYIRQQLDSILAQDEEDVRILVRMTVPRTAPGNCWKEYEASRGDRCWCFYGRSRLEEQLSIS